MTKPTQIVIIGAGFGGSYLARTLAGKARPGEFEITLVNKTNHFLFTPLLHEVATGGLSPLSVAEPLREIFSGGCVKILQGTVDSIDSAAKKIKIGNREISYDYAVLTTGADSNYYGISGAKEHSLPLKSLDDAALIRSRVIDAFEKAALSEDPKEHSRLLSFVVVGGGATGVELAAELIEFATSIRNRYFSSAKCFHTMKPAVTLVNATPELLGPFDPVIRTYALKRLQKMGVEVRLNIAVKEIAADCIKLGNEACIYSENVIWTAGVAAAAPKFIGTQPELAGGRVVIDEFFRVKGTDGLYALGDVAALLQKDGKALPMLAQVATQQAGSVAYNILGAIRGYEPDAFRYHSKGSLVSLGRFHAVGKVFGVTLRGGFAWFVWRTTYLFKFHSWKKRIRIMFDWTLDLFYDRDTTKLR